MSASKFSPLPWNDEQEFHALHARDIFSRYRFYHVAMVGKNETEFLQYIVQKARIFKGARVLDLGCGSGFVVNELSRHCDALGISSSAECVEQCQVNYPESRFNKANMEDFTCPDNTHVLALESLGYADLEKTLKTTFDNLKAGGYFYVKEWSLKQKENAREQENREYWTYYWKYTQYKVRDFIRTAEDCGFRLLEFTDLSDKINNKLFFDSLKYHKAPFELPHPTVEFNLPSEFLFRKPG